MLLNLMQGREFDIRSFAEALAKSAQEGVLWERRKLEWIREEEQKGATTKEQDAA